MATARAVDRPREEVEVDAVGADLVARALVEDRGVAVQRQPREVAAVHAAAVRAQEAGAVGRARAGEIVVVLDNDVVALGPLAQVVAVVVVAVRVVALEGLPVEPVGVVGVGLRVGGFLVAGDRRGRGDAKTAQAVNAATKARMRRLGRRRVFMGCSNRGDCIGGRLGCSPCGEFAPMLQRAMIACATTYER